jgi:glutamate synthase domain-containing protein 2
MAEHVAKAIICGADGVILDLPLLIALECRLCKKCLRGLPCPVKIGNINIGWATQRIMNLMAAWRSQLLEVLGAMGLREVRRLRGEMGRAMLFQDLEQEIFAPLFGQRIQELH